LALRVVANSVMADFIHHGDAEAVDFGPVHADGIDEDSVPVQEFQQSFGHRRTDGIHGAGEQHGGRKSGHSLTP